MHSPYLSPSTNFIYALLFCDDIGRYKTNHSSPEIYPWNVLFSGSASNNDLEKIAIDHSLESRVRLLAYNQLRANSSSIATKELLGVIVEVGLEEGLDVLAAYQDGTARYINYTQKILVWEAPNEASLALTKELFEASGRIIQQIGPWNKQRLPSPVTGNVRISFLVSDGLYFGEGPMGVLFSDALAEPALEVATELMQFLTNYAIKTKK